MKIRELLCYPSPDPKCVKERTKELAECGVQKILRGGMVFLKGFQILGKGHSSVILKVRLKDLRSAAVKVLRSDSKRDNLSLECSLLVKGYPVTPEVYCCSKNLIVMELIEGYPLKEIFKKNYLKCSDALLIVLKVFGAVSWLDRVGVDHKELSRPSRHIFITNNGRVKIIDFETATGGPAKNLLRVFSWFMMRSWFGRECCRGIEELLNSDGNTLLKLYRLEPRKVFREVVREVIRRCYSAQDIYL